MSVLNDNLLGNLNINVLNSKAPEMIKKNNMGSDKNNFYSKK